MSDKDARARQTYLDNIVAKSGKTIEQLSALAKKQGLATYSELLAWLKSEFNLGHGHANYAAHLILGAGKPHASVQDGIAALFGGNKAHWRKSYDALMAKVGKFGSDIDVTTTKTYASLRRNEKKFAVLAPSTPERFDIGIKLKGAAPTTRLESAGTWNSMVTHRIQITDPKQIDQEVVAWLKRAYDAA